ncbi:hypothetical protein BDQ17DRAFT_1437309 [Cyathus striatus]|nr:hypothetical protein BDQ17DRAFT_1437309 [Cyathus striatus]
MNPLQANCLNELAQSSAYEAEDRMQAYELLWALRLTAENTCPEDRDHTMHHLLIANNFRDSIPIPNIMFPPGIPSSKTAMLLLGNTRNTSEGTGLPMPSNTDLMRIDQIWWWTPGPDDLDRIHTLQQIAASQGNWQCTGTWLMMGDASTFRNIARRAIHPGNALSCVDQIHDHPSPLSDLITMLHKPQSGKSTTHSQVALPHPPGPQNRGSNDPSTPLIGAGTSGGSNNLPVDLLRTGANRGTNGPPMDHPMDTMDKTGLPHINPETLPYMRTFHPHSTTHPGPLSKTTLAWSHGGVCKGCAYYTIIMDYVVVFGST